MSYYNAGVGFDQEDWYKIDIPYGGIFHLNIQKHGYQPTNIRFRDGLNPGNPDIISPPIYLNWNDSPPEGWSWSYPLLEGPYYFQVLGNNDPMDYSLTNSIEVPQWGEDTEPNSVQSEAQTLVVGDSIGGIVGYYKAGMGVDFEDWYMLDVPTAGLLSFHILKEGYQPANAYLYNANGQIAQQYLNWNADDVTLSRLVTAGKYWLMFKKGSSEFRYKVVSSLLPAPVADFSYIQNNARFVFENKTTGSDLFSWNFDDGTPNVSSINPLHEYAMPGEYDVCLLAENRGGKDTLCTRITVRGLARIFPNSGGNAGDATITVFGGGLDTFYTISLKQNGVTAIQSVSVGSGPKGSLVTTLDLRGKAEGVYDVEVVKSGGASYILPGGFTIKKGIAADPWIRINGRNRILYNTWTTYTVKYGNNGNVDASVVPAWLVFERTPGFDLKFVNVTFTGLDADEEMFVDLDTIFSKPIKVRVYPLILPVIPPGIVGSFQVKIKTGQNIKMSAWTEKPWFQSPLNENKLICLETTIREASESISDKEVQGLCLLKKTKENYENMLQTTFSNKKSNYLEGRIIVALIGQIGKIFRDCDIKDEALKEKYRNNMIKGIFALVDKTHGGVFFKNSSLNGENCSGEFEPQYPQSSSVTAVSSLDPNEKSGLTGYGDDNYILDQKTIPYTIHFENKASATAPAHTVYVTDTLDKTTFDLSSFSLGDIVIGDQTIRPEQGLNEFVTDEKINGKNVIARVYAKIDQNTGIAQWVIRSLDPVMLEDIEDPDLGFLPPNITNPEGQGSVSFTVKVKGEPIHDEIDI
ncbi:MAG: hypothetical protein IPO92_22790 [Saprospiraceae bacterium]|nr:hypothetical protein [Saprospiraceae bacterium]